MPLWKIIEDEYHGFLGGKKCVRICVRIFTICNTPILPGWVDLMSQSNVFR